jgi:hypothetical protein
VVREVIDDDFGPGNGHGSYRGFPGGANPLARTGLTVLVAGTPVAATAQPVSAGGGSGYSGGGVGGGGGGGSW